MTVIVHIHQVDLKTSIQNSEQLLPLNIFLFLPYDRSKTINNLNGCFCSVNYHNYIHILNIHFPMQKTNSEPNLMLIGHLLSRKEQSF